MTDGFVEFQLRINRQSITDTLRFIQNQFDSSGVSINNLSITSQGLSNVRAQVERALSSVDVGVGEVGTGPATRPAPTQPTRPSRRNQDIELQIRAQRAQAQALLATDAAQSAELRKQADSLSEALRFKRQLAQVRNAGISPEEARRAEELARDLNRLNRQRIDIEVDLDTQGAVRQARRSSAIIEGIFQGVGQRITEFLVEAFQRGVQAVGDFGRASLDAAQQVRGIDTSLRASLGSAEAAGESYQFASETLNRLNANVREGTRQYAALIAATQSAGVEQDLANEFFESFTQTLVSNGLAAEAQNRAFNASSQIFAKNRLSAEELRQQLAEALPSAIGIVANGLGEIGLTANGTTEELNELLESGSVSAEQFARAWIAGSDQFQAAVDPINESITRAENSLFRFQVATGNALAPLQQVSLDAFSQSLQTIADSDAFDIVSEGINNFLESLEASGDIQAPIERLVTTVAEGLAGSFAAAATTAGDFIENLSPEDIDVFTRRLEVFFDVVTTGISLIDNILTPLIDLNTGIANVGETLLNTPNWPGFFDEGIRLAGLILNPLEAVGIAVENIRALLSGFEAVDANPVGDFAGSVGQANQATTALFAEISSGVRQLSQESTSAAQQSARQIEEANRAALQSFERDTASTILGIEQAQASAIASVRQQQAEGLISDEDADAQIRAIEQSTQARIAAKDQEIQAIQRLELQGVLTAEQSADRQARANLEKTELVISGLEAEIDAQNRARDNAIAALDEQLETAQLLNQVRAEENDIASETLNQQRSLIDAQQSLATSQASLNEARLERTLDVARAEEDVTAAQRAAVALAQERQRAIQEEFDIQSRLNSITVDQNRLEAQRGILTAEVAAAEASIAVEKARAEGATQTEISGLQQLAQLATQRVQQARDEAVITDEINRNLGTQLEVDRALAQEELARLGSLSALLSAEEELANRQQELGELQIQSAERVAAARASAIEGLFGIISQEASQSAEEGLETLERAEERLQLARSAGFFQEGEAGAGAQATQQAIQQVQQLLRSGASDQQLARAAFQQQENAAFLEALQLAGRGDIAGLAGADQGFESVNVAIQESSIAITDKLEEIRQALIEREVAAANRSVAVENLMVTTPDPVVDSAAILFDFTKQATEGRR